MTKENSPKKFLVPEGRFCLARETVTEDWKPALAILFYGWLNDLTSAFIAGGIVRSRDEVEKSSTLVLFNKNDCEDDE